MPQELINILALLGVIAFGVGVFVFTWIWWDC